MAEEFVVKFAPTICSGAESPCIRLFTVQEDRRLETLKQLNGTDIDAKPDNIIGDYGKCAMTGGPCVKAFVDKWFNAAVTVCYTMGALTPGGQTLPSAAGILQHLLTMSSVLVCQLGGVVSLVKDGQMSEEEIQELIEQLVAEYKALDNLPVDPNQAEQILGRKKEIIEALKGLDPPTPLAKWQLDCIGWDIDKTTFTHMNNLMQKFEVRDPESILNFMVHCSEETGRGTYSVEIIDKKQFERYNAMGVFKTWEDYIHWRGGGYIQVTTEENYKEFDKVMREELNIVDDKILGIGADYVGEQYPWEASIIWWTRIGKCNKGQDNGDSFDDTCYAMAGGGGRGWNYNKKLALRKRLVSEGIFF